MMVFPAKTSKISISIYTLRSSCLNKMSRNQACSQEVLLQKIFTNTEPSASRMAFSSSSQEDTYSELWDPKYKEYNIIKNLSTVEITDILNVKKNSQEIINIKIEILVSDANVLGTLVSAFEWPRQFGKQHLQILMYNTNIFQCLTELFGAAPPQPRVRPGAKHSLIQSLNLVQRLSQEHLKKIYSSLLKQNQQQQTTPKTRKPQPSTL